MPSAFTRKANGGLLRELRSTVQIGRSFNSASEPAPPLQPFEAIWDTGATNTAITQRVVDALGLQPISMAQVHTAAGVHTTEVYSICIRLEGGVGFTWVRVSRADLHGEDILIGMDVITQGDFAITNVGGVTVFSFRHPPHAHIDFVQEQRIRDAREQQQRTPPTVGMNRAERRAKDKAARKK